MNTPTIQVGSKIVICTMNGGSTEISPGIYSTGVNGVGMRVRDSSGSAITNATSQACASQISTIGSGGSYNFSGTLELVRTSGAIPSGAVLTRAGTQWAFGVYNTGIVLNNDNGSISTGSSSISASGNIVFRALTCTVSAPGNVVLKKTRLSKFQSIGDVDGASPFNVSLQCNDNALVGMTMDAASGYSVIDASNGVIGTFQQSGTAKGFGLQISRANGSVMPFQTRVDMGSITANSINNYGFSVQYRRVSSPVSSGVVTSGLVLTMDYQ
ncbi:MAG: fimbrial protein [Pseudomonas sp.]